MTGIDDRVAALSEQRRALLLSRLLEQRLRPSAIQSVPRSPGRTFLLSPAQEQVWLSTRLAPDGAVYNVPIGIELSGPLDVPLLRRALTGLIARHEVLRTRIVDEAGTPAQLVDAPSEARLTVVDLSPGPDLDRRRSLLLEAAERPFDLATDPPLSSYLFVSSPDHHVLLLVMSHLAVDGWSMPVLWRDLVACYRGGGDAAGLPPLPFHYADYALSRRAELRGPSMRRLTRYWSDQLAGLPTAELPLDRPRPPVQEFDGAVRHFTIPQFLAHQLGMLSRRLGATPFMTFLAAFSYVLNSYSGQEDIAIGTVTSGRRSEALQDLVGFFVNTVVLRADLSGGPSPQDLIARLKRTVMDAFEHDAMPFPSLVRLLGAHRDLGLSPLFQAMFTFVPHSSANWMEDFQLPGVTARPVEVDLHVAKFDLVLNIIETADGFTGMVEYNTHLFEPATVDDMTGRLLRILESMCAEPSRPRPTDPSDERRLPRAEDES